MCGFVDAFYFSGVFFLTCVVFQGQVFFCCMLFFQLRVVLLLSFFLLFFVFSRCGAFVWCSRPLFSDWRFHVCVFFKSVLILI